MSGRKILVTGACGYKGSVLVPKLLVRGYEVIAVDTQWFGDFLPQHKRLSKIKVDIRQSNDIDLDKIESIIHLASVANDPCGDLNPKLTWEISALATMQLADRAKKSGVKQFIYASSGSVYGIKSEPEVTEELSLEPISEYNKTKMVAERVLLSYEDAMAIQIVRPATVCGLSPRMRLDVSVNMLTMQALSRGVITVFGGTQIRPNIHIDDITDLYIYMLENPDKTTGIYNAGFENLSINDIAQLVKNKLSCDIEVVATQDPRSYRISSDKLLATGFQPAKSVSNAVDELIEAFQVGKLLDDERCYNVKWMRRAVL
jgi:nucleoside-diphosphate-sugar epimerase